MRARRDAAARHVHQSRTRRDAAVTWPRPESTGDAVTVGMLGVMPCLSPRWRWATPVQAGCNVRTRRGVSLHSRTAVYGVERDVLRHHAASVLTGGGR